ncbi:hypothetical protein QFZ56_000235 [Streptomyces achromogenes]|uniref:Uncharacterized protein n=1 Tax=Streptomyces achromogenes TaxID=67255 RepID=A0ABU0PSA8_STRAH|nr:hypothetical protein [Streptomyces achromogenes]
MTSVADRRKSGPGAGEPGAPSARLTHLRRLGAGQLGHGGAQDGVHPTDGGRTFTTLDLVRSASALGLGKAAPGASYRALYVVDAVKDVPCLHRHQRTRTPVRRPVLTPTPARGRRHDSLRPRSDAGRGVEGG